MTYDNVSRPAHYAGQGEIECIDFISAVLIPYQGVVAGDLQNVIKYIWRADFKGKIQDLHKALWYAKHAVNVIHSQREDTNKIARAWRTALAKRNSEEEKVFVLGMKQIQKHMSVNERKCFKKVINSIADGNLYQLVKGGMNLVSALEEWIHIYEEEKGKGGNTV